MSEKQFTLVYYYVPEDLDDPSMPNAFAISKHFDDITLGDIETNFPLQGEFIFRFKYKYNSATVWMDLSNRKCKVPKVDNRIILKVTRKVPKYTLANTEQKSETAAMNDYLI